MNSWKPYGNIKEKEILIKKLNVTDNVKERGAQVLKRIEVQTMMFHLDDILR